METTTNTKKIKWHSVKDDDFMNQTVYWIEGYRGFTNIDQHAIEIFSVKVMHPIAMLKRTQHTINICFGPYGETVYEEVLPFGTKISDAKRLAVDAAKRCNEEDNAGFILP